MDIKKVYLDLYTILMANQSMSVEDVMSLILPLITTKSVTKAFHKDEDDNVVAIFCYYHKRWEDVEVVEYGVKKSSATGLNTMCKEGVSHWTKQQSTAKSCKDIIMTTVASGELEPSLLLVELDKVETLRNSITPLEIGEGSYETLEELLLTFIEDEEEKKVS